jgi:hypothetical protein
MVLHVRGMMGDDDRAVSFAACVLPAPLFFDALNQMSVATGGIALALLWTYFFIFIKEYINVVKIPITSRLPTTSYPDAHRQKKMKLEKEKVLL